MLSRLIHTVRRAMQGPRFGFTIEATLQPNLSEAERDTFGDAFVEQVEAHKAVCGGGLNPVDVFVHLGYSWRVERAIHVRQQLLQWLYDHPAVQDACASDITDADDDNDSTYPPFPEETLA